MAVFFQRIQELRDELSRNHQQHIQDIQESHERDQATALDQQELRFSHQIAQLKEQHERDTTTSIQHVRQQLKRDYNSKLNALRQGAGEMCKYAHIGRNACWVSAIFELWILWYMMYISIFFKNWSLWSIWQLCIKLIILCMFYARADWESVMDISCTERSHTDQLKSGLTFILSNDQPRICLYIYINFDIHYLFISWSLLRQSLPDNRQKFKIPRDAHRWRLCSSIFMSCLISFYLCFLPQLTQSLW